MNRLETKFLGVDFKNPIVTSSGCFGFGLEYRDYFDPNVLGGIVVKGLTMEPRDGNYGTRIAETPGGMLNCVGLENPGIDYFETHILKDMKEAGITTNIIANINGKTVEEYIEIAKRVEQIKEVDIIELNISCPNVKDGGMAFGANPEVAGRVTREVRKVTTKPLVVKLSPNVTDIAYIAKVVEENGADAVSLINTLLGMVIDLKTKKPLLGNTFGGFSGPAVKPVALRMVYQVYKAVNIPIVGMGGISSTEDALEFIMAGASMVSLGTGIFFNPVLPVEVAEGLQKYCEENNIENINELVGIAHR
ncbi:dihydroorotate dehydrogenase [Fusobacterium ulcerans]|jgi:dihydroorotate dehydrogenase (NAD+) catalytic subunit|uniref:Dihydroorotate dehydrogenase n=1 Tax=Fusobacterium ulcerans TaxID=861 RepID=A0AAX2J9W6_9FUSO|nr:dihydroorotate dehydrogenase [Fusobacterium ulcerans]AVQ28702.1 dihydroorotate dehydrogenase [Fusobacterium ulcerans]EFS26179.1 dihydroorotate dehydrogenase [Fusobacterium ulcerans ATCC 49185]MCB8564571.1 dihydroorotate dehydrogenase [Fusobacterium ulcerans]MCB8650542.1 dihydroorotate dehydrogenase [Fusobacterium ulcerans]MEE0137196.1 dihydroorotate dehydrogenase [Fusobacterium ulcerans]